MRLFICRLIICPALVLRRGFGDHGGGLTGLGLRGNGLLLAIVKKHDRKRNHRDCGTRTNEDVGQ